MPIDFDKIVREYKAPYEVSLIRYTIRNPLREVLQELRLIG